MTTPREVLRASREAERKEHDHDRVLPGREHDQQVRPEGYTSSIGTYMIRFVSGQWARTRLSDSAGPTRISRTRHRGLPPRHEWRCETGDPTRCFRPSLSTMEGTRPDASGGLGSSGAGRGGGLRASCSDVTFRPKPPTASDGLWEEYKHAYGARVAADAMVSGPVWRCRCLALVGLCVLCAVPRQLTVICPTDSLRMGINTIVAKQIEYF